MGVMAKQHPSHTRTPSTGSSGQARTAAAAPDACPGKPDNLPAPTRRNSQVRVDENLQPHNRSRTRPSQSVPSSCGNDTSCANVGSAPKSSRRRRSAARSAQRHSQRRQQLISCTRLALLFIVRLCRPLQVLHLRAKKPLLAVEDTSSPASTPSKRSIESAAGSSYGTPGCALSADGDGSSDDSGDAPWSVGLSRHIVPSTPPKRHAGGLRQGFLLQ